MATEKKLIFIVLTALIKINLGFEKSCNVSTSTIEIVQSCPTDEKTYKEAAERKNCEAIQNTCESFVYHCFRNKGKNAMIDVCAPWLNIIGQVCGTYDEDFMSIKRLDNEPCMNFTNTCPWSYNSSEQFKYPGCYELLKSEEGNNNKSEEGNNNKSEEKQGGEIIAGVLAAVCVTCLILFILMYIIHVRNKKKENQDHNPEEIQPMNRSNSSAANIDNEATAGNQISQDQTEYPIPVSQEPTDTVTDTYTRQRTPNTVPSSFPQQETSKDRDSNGEISPNTVSSTSTSTTTESYHPTYGDNPEETQPMNRSNSSAANIDNEATAGNQISRDQTEYPIPVSQEPTDTVNDTYTRQRTPNTVPSSFPQQETSKDRDLNGEISLNTFSSTSTSTTTESYHPAYARDIAIGNQHVNDAFTELDGESGTIPFEDMGATSQLQDHNMKSIGGSVSDIIEEVKKFLDDAKSRIDCSVRETYRKKLKEAEEELDMIRAENRELKKNISDLEKRLSHKDRKISRQKRDIEEKDQKFEEMQKEISQLKDEMIQLEKERGRDRGRENNFDNDC